MTATGTTRPTQAPAAPVPAPMASPRERGGRWGLFGTPVVVGVLVIASRPVTDPEAWWNVRAGQLLRQTWTFVGPDPLSSSGGQFVSDAWASDVLASLSYDALGTPGLVLMRSLVLIALAALFLVAGRQQADPVPTVIATFVGLIGCASLGERPMTAGVVLTMVAVIGWRRAAESQRPPWWLVPVGTVWACVHSSWFIGPLIGAVTVLGLSLEGRLSPPQTVRFAGVVVASYLASALTPLGPALLSSPLDSFPASGAVVGGWAYVDLGNPGAVVVGGSLLVLTAGLLRSGRRPAWWKLGHGLVALALSLTFTRLVPFAACLAVPLVAEGIQVVSRRGRAHLVGWRERRAFVTGVLLTVAAAGCLAIPLGAVSRDIPARFATNLARLPDATVVLAYHQTSSWIMFAEPRLRVAIDTRVRLYDPAYLTRYVSALKAEPGWGDFVTLTGATSALLPVDAPLASALQQRWGWRQVQTTDGFVLLVSVSGDDDLGDPGDRVPDLGHPK